MSTPHPGPTPWDVIKDLYARELNAGLQIDWDGGIVVWIGGPIFSEVSALPDEHIEVSRLPRGLNHLGNSIRARQVFAREEFDLIAPWMIAEARRIYPDAFKQNVAGTGADRDSLSVTSAVRNDDGTDTGMDTTAQMWSYFNEIITEGNLPFPVQTALYALMEGQAKVTLNEGSWFVRLVPHLGKDPLR